MMFSMNFFQFVLLSFTILNATAIKIDFLSIKQKIDSKYYPKIDCAIKHPCLIHYCATYKPWHIECNSPFKKLWRQSYKKTFGKNCRLQFKNKGLARIKWCIKLVLNTLNIKKYADFRKSIVE